MLQKLDKMMLHTFHFLSLPFMDTNTPEGKMSVMFHGGKVSKRKI